MRKTARPSLWFRNAGIGQQFDGVLPSFFDSHAALELQDLGNLVTNGEQRVERGHGLLEDHGDVAAAHFAQLRLVHAQQICIFKDSFAAHPSASGQTQQA